ARLTSPDRTNQPTVLVVMDKFCVDKAFQLSLLFQRMLKRPGREKYDENRRNSATSSPAPSGGLSQSESVGGAFRSAGCRQTHRRGGEIPPRRGGASPGR